MAYFLCSNLDTLTGLKGGQITGKSRIRWVALDIALELGSKKWWEPTCTPSLARATTFSHLLSLLRKVELNLAETILNVVATYLSSLLVC